jgi:catechol 2,3-dioxygenase-like lactoylglutathione lyase family enzyme
MLSSVGIPVIMVSDIDKSTEFYRDILGFPVKVETPDWVEFELPEGGLALHAGAEPSPESSPRHAGRVSFSLQVEDLGATFESLREKGVEFIMGPTKQDFGASMAVFQDPDGVSWHLVQPEA